MDSAMAFLIFDVDVRPHNEAVMTEMITIIAVGIILALVDFECVKRTPFRRGYEL